MKNQRFRYKLIALLMVGLIAAAGIHGARTIPLSDSSGSLRDAILRLTGQATPVPSAQPEETPGLEPDASPDADPQAAGTASLDPAQSLPPPTDNSLGSIIPGGSTAASPTESIPGSTETPPPGGAVSLSEALSSYFGSSSPTTAPETTVKVP